MKWLFGKSAASVSRVKFVPQRFADDCGVCCVAMITFAPYEVARWAVFPDNYAPAEPNVKVERLTFKSTVHEIRAALKRLGVDPARRMRRAMRWDFGHEAIVAIGEYEIPHSSFHWVCHRDGIVYDPSLREPVYVDDYYWPPSGVLTIKGP